MDIMAVVSDTRYGTAQDLTFILPIGVLFGVCLWGFFQRSPKTSRRRDEALVSRAELERRE